MCFWRTWKKASSWKKQPVYIHITLRSLSANMFNSCKLKNLEIRFLVHRNHGNNRGRLASSSQRSEQEKPGLLGLFFWPSCLTSGPKSLLPLMNKTSQTCKSCYGSVFWFRFLQVIYPLSLSSWFLGYTFKELEQLCAFILAWISSALLSTPTLPVIEVTFVTFWTTLALPWNVW